MDIKISVIFKASNVHQGHYVYVNKQDTGMVINLFAYQTIKNYKEQVDKKIETFSKTMAISEYSKKNITFRPHLNHEQYLLSLSSGERSDFIRKAIDEAIKQNDKDKSDAEIIESVLPKSHIPEFGSDEWNNACQILFGGLTIKKDSK